MDKNGVALGHITVVGPSGERTPFGLDLVRQGLARVDERGTTTLAPGVAHALLAAQAEARAGKRGIWCVRMLCVCVNMCVCVCVCVSVCLEVCVASGKTASSSSDLTHPITPMHVCMCLLWLRTRAGRWRRRPRRRR